MTDNHRLVMARIRAEMEKGTCTTEVIMIVARVFRRQQEADRAVSSRTSTETKSSRG